MARDIPVWLVLDRTRGDLEGQIYQAFRARILSGVLRPGAALPSTRALAGLLGTARSTVVAGYDRLRAEGFIAGRTGSATRVADVPAMATPPAAALPRPAREPERFAPFRPGLPDLDLFPARAWSRCLAARARHLRLHDLGYGEELGLPALRAAIAEHVARSRAVVADPAQVIVLPSTAAAIDLIARLTLGPGDAAWIEDPGYPTAQALLRRAGARIVPVPVDAQGIDPATPAIPPKLIYVSPSHQYPTGVAMSLARRMALLDQAARHHALIVEDDYDSEFHYAGRPLAALQGLGLGQGHGSPQVAYIGTFSKVLAPGLRLAYAILPPRLLSAAQAAIRLSGASVAVHVQAAMADFIAEGHLAAHIRRMRRIYHTRMEDTAAMIATHPRFAVGARDGGLQLALYLHDRRADDRALARALHRQGLGAMPLSGFYLGPPRPGLLLGIASATPDRIALLDAALRPIARAGGNPARDR